MDKAEFSDKPQKNSAYSHEDIPEALRETSEIKPRSRLRLVFVIGGLLGLGAIALGSGFWYFTSVSLKNTNSVPSPAISPSPPAAQTAEKVNPQDSNSDTLLGHFAYSEAPRSELQPIVSNSQIKLRTPAAKQFKAMLAAARSEGVLLVPISGFRSATEQEHLFFEVKAQRGQVATKRAEVSAPPGYSEHHTGYAVDIGDGRVSATNLNTTFEKTKAFKWLSANAARFSFEMSFPQDNPQGVSYEPWHWRYVGDRDSLETFYKARGDKQEVKNETQPQE